MQLIRSDDESGLLVVKASGLADIKTPYSPKLIFKEGEEPPTDGIMELDFKLGDEGETMTGVQLEFDIVLKIKNLPSWVQGIRINAEENSEIELL